MSTNDYSNNFSKPVGSARSKFAAKFSNLKKPNFKLPQNLKHIKTSHIIAGGILILLVLTFFAGRFLAPKDTLGSLNSDERTEAPAPIATQQLNKTFQFPLVDDKGKEVAKIKYTIESANLQNAFIYQGKLATAVKGRTFLIFNLKITNPYEKTIEINAKDYIRVKLNGSNEQLAPEIHNDPVQIQANSTKYTRIGLPINDSDKNIVILVGELKGDKETIKLNLEK